MELVFAVLNLLGLGGLAMFIIWTFKGLHARIENLTQLANEQKETLEAVRTRATELDQLRKDYRQGLDDFQHLGQRLEERRGQLLAEVEAALQRKDEQLAAAKQLELKDLELKQQSLDMIPQLQERLTETVSLLEQQTRALSSVLGSNAQSLPRPLVPFTLSDIEWLTGMHVSVPWDYAERALWAHRAHRTTILAEQARKAEPNRDSPTEDDEQK